MARPKMNKKESRPRSVGRPTKCYEVEEPEQIENVDEALAEVEEMLPAETPCDEIELAETEEVVHHKRGCLSDEEKADVSRQKAEMRLMAGNMLLHFKGMVKNKELDFEQELKLFKLISPYLGYENEGRKNADDLGMDACTMRYVEISARVRKVAEKSSPMSKYK